MPVKKSYNNRKDKDWLELCEYIHDVVLEYDNSQSLSRFMLFRLKGLKKINILQTITLKAQPIILIL